MTPSNARGSLLLGALLLLAEVSATDFGVPVPQDGHELVHDTKTVTNCKHGNCAPSPVPTPVPTHWPTHTWMPTRTYSPTPVPTPSPTINDPGQIQKVWFTFVDVDRVDVAWEMPTGYDDEGLRIKKYEIELRLLRTHIATYVSTDLDTLAHSFTGLECAKEYRVRVRAWNQFGFDAESLVRVSRSCFSIPSFCCDAVVRSQPPLPAALCLSRSPRTQRRACARLTPPSGRASRTPPPGRGPTRSSARRAAARCRLPRPPSRSPA